MRTGLHSGGDLKPSVGGIADALPHVMSESSYRDLRAVHLQTSAKHNPKKAAAYENLCRMVVGITHRLWLLLRHMADQFSDELLEHMFRDWRPSVDSYGMGPTRRYLQAVMDGIGLGFYTSKEAPVPGVKKSVFELAQNSMGAGT